MHHVLSAYVSANARARLYIERYCILQHLYLVVGFASLLASVPGAASSLPQRRDQRTEILSAACTGAAVALRLQEFPLKLILFKRKHVQLVEFLFLIEYRQNKYAYAVVCAALSLSGSRMCVCAWIFFLSLYVSLIHWAISVLRFDSASSGWICSNKNDMSLHCIHIRPRARFG